MKLGPLAVSVHHLHHGNYDFRTVRFAWRDIDIHSYVGGCPWREMSVRDYLSLVPLALHSARRVVREIIRIEQEERTA